MPDLHFHIIEPAGFEWDDRKRTVNLAKHGVDFEDASQIFYGGVILSKSDRHDEERWLAIGKSGDRTLAVIFTNRDGRIRIISARHPRSNEERAYRQAEVGRSPQGPD